MSITNKHGFKVVLPRTGPTVFWRLIHDNFAAEDQRKWKYLAMLALRENCGWSLEQIGATFNHPRGHVTRCLARIKTELQCTFQSNPDEQHHAEDDFLRLSEPEQQAILHEEEELVSLP